MATKAQKGQKETKRAAVAARLVEMQGNVDLLTGMLDENVLDVLILALGIGHVEVD